VRLVATCTPAGDLFAGRMALGALDFFGQRAFDLPANASRAGDTSKFVRRGRALSRGRDS